MLEDELEQLRAQAGGAIHRIPLARIDAVVAAHLGPARVRGNARPAMFYRQIAMYLAHRVGGWSMTRIGKFYNGRDHSTVYYAIRRIEALRHSDSDLNAILEMLAEVCKQAEVPLSEDSREKAKRDLSLSILALVEDDFSNRLAERIAQRVVSLLGREIQVVHCDSRSCDSTPPYPEGTA